MLASTREPRFSKSAPTPLKKVPLRYELVCAACGRRHWDDGIRLQCAAGCAALLQSAYLQRAFTPRTHLTTAARYADWLPGEAHLLQAPLPVLTQLPWLQELFRIPQLYVLISGYWPERGAFLPTGSFKDLEADAVLARLDNAPDSIVALASAGNTAMAFATAATARERNCIVVVTAETKNLLRVPRAAGAHVHLVTIDGDAKYDDAITLAGSLASADDGNRIVLEGGVKNIARRDGVGVAFLQAVEALGRLPKIYLQAVGSAAGALAVNEAALRLRAAGYSGDVPQLYLAQNSPFTPLTRSWNANSQALLAEDDVFARTQIAQIRAGVLSNTKPPYAIGAGIHQALHGSKGRMFSVTNAAVDRAVENCWRYEHVILDPAAAVAIGALEELAPELQSERDPIVLHLTGAKPLVGFAPLRSQREYQIQRDEINKPDAVHQLRERILTAATM